LTRIGRTVDGVGVAIELAELWLRGMGELRYQPTDKRVRARIGERTVVDSVRAALVWEPRRAVPHYAVPVDDVRVSLVPVARRPRGTAVPGGQTPSDNGGFRGHTTKGEELSVRVDGSGQTLYGAAFRPADPDLAGYVVLDFDAFDTWLEEDEPVQGHPCDPYHRVDVRRSSRHVRIMLGGRVLAESRRPWLVFETLLPMRFYLPRDDVDERFLRPSVRRTRCPYKGEAVYWSVQLDAYLAEDLAWSYPEPLPAVADLADLLCFFDERLETIVDGMPRERPLMLGV
jgi:uncharacterized protein (DUF427 family)